MDENLKTEKSKLYKDGGLSLHTLQHSEDSKTRIQCIKNIIVVGIAGFCTHIINEVVAALSSSLGENVVRAMTVKTFCVMFGCYLAPIVAKLLTVRVCLILGPLSSACFIASFLEPNYILLLSVSSIYGLILGVFYVIALYHIMTCTFLYADLKSLSNIMVSGFSNAYLWVMFSLSGVTGNLIISFHLNHYRNLTMADSHFSDMCGREFCPNYVSNTSIIKPPTRESMNVLIYILIAIGITGFLVSCLLMDNIGKHTSFIIEKDTGQIWRHLLTVLKLFCDLKLVLLLPVIVTHGMVQMFPDVDYTQGYVTCILGVHDVGYVMLCTTGSSTVGNVISASLGTVLRPRYIVLGAFFLLSAIFTLMLAWHLDSHTFAIFILAALIGFCDGLARTQISSYIVVLLRDRADAASSVYFILNVLGHSLIFTWDMLICMEIKLSILLALTASSGILFLIVDYKHERTVNITNDLQIKSTLIDSNQEKEMTDLTPSSN